MEALAKADMTQINKEMGESGKTYLSNLPKRQLPTMNESTKVRLDMSVTLTSDIQAPIQQIDGSWKWGVLYPAGTRVNPLDRVTPHQALFIFDGASEEQLKFAKRVNSLLGERVMMLEGGMGDINKDNEVLDIGTMYADAQLMQRFRVTALPAFLYPGEGPDKGFMVQILLAAPFKLDHLAGWSVAAERLKPKTQSTSKKTGKKKQ